MKVARLMSTGVILLFLATTIPAFAKKGQEKKGGEGKGQQAEQQSQHAQQAQQQPQHTQQANQVETVAYKNGNNGNDGNRNNGNNGNHYGRIPDDHYRANFGRAHAFRMGRPRFIEGYNRFQYSGYWFGYDQPWPAGWGYDDEVYVEYVGGVYYMYNPRHSGIYITLNLF